MLQPKFWEAMVRFPPPEEPSGPHNGNASRSRSLIEKGAQLPLPRLSGLGSKNSPAPPIDTCSPQRRNAPIHAQATHTRSRHNLKRLDFLGKNQALDLVVSLSLPAAPPNPFQDLHQKALSLSLQQKGSVVVAVCVRPCVIVALPSSGCLWYSSTRVLAWKGRS
jgi:hypothetical protein